MHQSRERQRLDSLVNHYLPVGSFRCKRLLFQVKTYFMVQFIWERHSMFTMDRFIRNISQKELYSIRKFYFIGDSLVGDMNANHDQH